ncbi:biotin synthase auxiliary protein BsaP [Planotetraspora thailandica]|uniref:biotin synthase auxiliary protein BsaP n=1 Tax=Planotetraspora thailandica TaxID=487172 RepID=UPI004032D6B2
MDPFCDHCGGSSDEGDHTLCQAARAMEPPRYCPRCRRRMIVQVTPRNWSARCSEHGVSAG